MFGFKSQCHKSKVTEDLQKEKQQELLERKIANQEKKKVEDEWQVLKREKRDLKLREESVADKELRVGREIKWKKRRKS